MDMKKQFRRILMANAWDDCNEIEWLIYLFYQVKVTCEYSYYVCWKYIILYIFIMYQYLRRLISIFNLLWFILGVMNIYILLILYLINFYIFKYFY